MFTNPHNQNLLNDVMRVLNGETTEQPIRPIPMWLTEAAEEAVKSLDEAYNSGEVMTLEIKRDILRKHLNEAISTCADCEVTKETPLQYEEAIAEVKRAGKRPTTGVPAGASKEDHEKSRKANPFRASLGKGVPAGAKKEEFEEDEDELDEANQRLKKSKPYEEVYYKWFDGVEVSIMDMGKIAKEIQAALDTKADLNKVMPELVKKYGKNSPTKKEEFEEDELDEEVEQIDELSPALLGRYIKKATHSAMTSGYRFGQVPKGRADRHDPNLKKALKREKGIAKATDKLLSSTREDVNEAKQSGSFAAFFKTKEDSTFATNALRFRTEAEAKQYGRDLFNRWFGASEWKVMPHTDKPNHEIVNNELKAIKESSQDFEEFAEMVMESDPTEFELREFLTQLTSEEVTILRNIINETR